jgi:hypothetical protein
MLAATAAQNALLIGLQDMLLQATRTWLWHTARHTHLLNGRCLAPSQLAATMMGSLDVSTTDGTAAYALLLVLRPRWLLLLLLLYL